MPVDTADKPKSYASKTEISSALKQLRALKEQLQTTLSPKLATAIDEKTKEVVRALGFKDMDPVKVDHLSSEIGREASLDVLDNIGHIQDITASTQVIADSITQALLAHPLTRTQAMQMNEAEIFHKAEKQIGSLLNKFQIQSDLEKMAVLSNLASISELEKPSPELQAQISNEVDRHVQKHSPLAPRNVNNTLKENTFKMTRTYTENLNAKTRILIEQGQIPTLIELNNLKTETFNQSSPQISLNTSQFKDKVDPKELSERVSYVLDLKPMTQNQTETLGLGRAEPGILTFTKGTGASGFTVGFGISNNQPAQVGAYNSLLVYDKDWLEKTEQDQTKQIETIKKKTAPTLRDRIKANFAQKKLQVLQNARAFQAKNQKLVETYQEYFQTRPEGSRLHASSQAAQNTTSAMFNDYRGAWVPRSISTNTGTLAQRTFGGLAFKFGNFRLASASKAIKAGKGLISKVSIPMMIASATEVLMKKMAVGTGLVFGAVALYFMKLGAAALKGFIIGAAIGGTVGAGAGAALGLAIAAPFGPFAPLVAVVTVPLGAAIGGFVGATIGGVAGGLIGYGLASGTTTAVTAGVGVGVGGTVGAYVGYIAGATAGAAVATTLVGICAVIFAPCIALEPILVPVFAVGGGFVGGIIGGYVGSLIGAAIGYGVGHYVIGTIGAPLTGAAAGAAIGFFIGGPPGALIGAGVGYLAGGGWHQVADFIAGAGSAGGAGLAATGGFITGAISTAWGITTGLISGAIGTTGSIIGSIWGGITGGISISTTAVAVGVGGPIATLAYVAIQVANINTPASFFNNGVDVTSQPAGPNIYVTVTKTANPTFISNSNLPTDVNFLVTVKANSFTLINVICTDITVLKKSNGTQQNLSTTLVGPICPATLNPSQVLNFSFSTHADNTPDFQNSTITNDFNVNFDVQGVVNGSPQPTSTPGGGTACTATDGFNQLLPNPIPSSTGATSTGSLPVDPAIVQAAIQAQLQTGVPCEMLVGMHYREALWDANSSFLSGATIGTSPEPNITLASACTGYGGTWMVDGCHFASLNQTAIVASSYILGKMALLTGSQRPPQNFNEMIGAMSYYNGGGNSNCGAGVPYTGPCPPPIGIDDPYPINHFDSVHASMYLIYCGQFKDANGVIHGIPCNPPKILPTDGAATAAKEYYLSIGGR